MPRLTSISWRNCLLRGMRYALQQRCALCVASSGGHLLCGACESDLPRLVGACPACALPVSAPGLCNACRAQHPPWSRAIAALLYAFPVDRLLVELKYGGQLALAEWAGTTLASTVASVLAARERTAWPHCVVALPLATARLRERGFNQAAEIARRVADRLGLPLLAPLHRISGSVPQTALAWRERARNVRGAFTAHGELRGARVALVDDVMTTGATLAAATRALGHADAADVECWVVARTLPPDSQRSPR